MKKLFLLTIFTILLFVNGKSQVTWEKLFSKRSTDVFRCVREVPAGGYIAAGYTADSSANDSDAYVVRLNTSGDTIWTYTYNGPLSKKDLFYKVINTSDGGFALCGYTSSVTGLSDDVLYMKLNSAGQQEWVKFYGGSGKDRGQDIIETPSGHFVIVGYTTSSPAQYFDAFMIRTDSSGDTLWTKRYGGSNYDDANTVRRLSNGGFILGGQSYNGANGFDQYLIRTNSSGDTIWTKRFGTLQTDNIDCIEVLSNGFILAGSTNTITTGDDGYLVKTDTGGNVIWAKSYGGTSPDDFHTVDITDDGGFVACGTTSSSGPLQPNMWMMRTTSNGDSVWSKAYGGDNHDHGYSGCQTSDGGYIIVGHTGSFGFNYEDAYIIKTDTSGNSINKLTYTTVLAIVSPTSTTCGTPGTQIKLKLRNFGNQSVPNIPVTVEITGSHTQTINQTFSASSDTVTLSTTINTSAGGTYTFKCYTNNSNDVYPENNSITGTFTILPTAPSPTSVTNDTRCGTGSLTLSASSSGTLYWFNMPSGGSQVFSGTSFVTPSLSSTTTYYVQTGLICASPRLPSVATINPIAIDPITTGDSRCGSGTLTLVASAPDSIKWYNAPSGGSIVDTGSVFVTPFLTTNTNYYAQATNGLCPSNRVVANAIVSSVANDPVTTSAQRCGPGTITLIANSVDPVIWYDSPVSGSQVGSGNSLIIPSLTFTTTYYAQADNGCLSNRVAAIATVNSLANDPVTTTGQNCGPGTVVLSANAADPVTWYDALIGGNQIGFGPSITTPLIFSNRTYYAQSHNGTCPSNRIPALAIILSLPNINLGNDTVVNGMSYLVDAGLGFSSYLWSTGATTASITITFPDTFCVTVTDASGCMNDDCIFVDLINTISDPSQKKLISIYPNPTNGNITISNTTSFSDSDIEIINITGEIIKRISADNTSVVVTDLSSFAKGVYFLKINVRDHTEIHKIIIQ